MIKIQALYGIATMTAIERSTVLYNFLYLYVNYK